MKRLWFAALFLLIAGGLCIGEQCYVRTFYNELTEKLDTAIAYEKNDDKEKLKDSVKDIQRYWRKNNDLLFTIAEHGVLDNLGEAIRILDDTDKDIGNALNEAKALTLIFYENQRVSTANIF